MSSDAHADTPPTENLRQPTSRIRQTAIVLAVAAAIAGVGGAAVYAATDHQSTDRHGAWRPPGPPPGAPTGNTANQNAGLAEKSLHGEFVTSNPAGGFQTVIVQTGTITAVTAQSITARSADGFTQSYVIPPSAGQGAPPFTVDQSVTVRATRDGQVATVTNIGFADTPAR